MLYCFILLVLYYRWTRKNEGHLIKIITIEAIEIFIVLWSMVLLGSVSKVHYVMIVVIVIVFEAARRIIKKTGPVKLS